MDAPVVLRFDDGLNTCEWVHKRDYDRLQAELAAARRVLDLLPAELLRRARARIDLNCQECAFFGDLGRCSAGSRCIPADDAAALEQAARAREGL